MINIIFAFVWFVLAIVVHELGHMIMLKKCGQEAVFDLKKFSVPYDETLLTAGEERMILHAGVWAGFFPLLFMKWEYLVFVGIPFYFLIGCRADFKRLGELRKLYKSG